MILARGASVIAGRARTVTSECVTGVGRVGGSQED